MGEVLVTILMICLFMGGVVFYLLPALIANKRHHNNANAIFALNLVLGWTLLGWCAALIWSMTNDVKKEVV